MNTSANKSITTMLKHREPIEGGVVILLLITLLCNNIQAAENNNIKEGDVTDVYLHKPMWEYDTSCNFKYYGCKRYYEESLLKLMLRGLQLSSLESLVFACEDWRLSFAISDDKFNEFVVENNIPLQNTNIQQLNGGDIIYNTTVKLTYPFINIPIKYIVAKGHFDYNADKNCVEVFFKPGQETARIIMYTTFSPINASKYIEFRNNYIKKLLNVDYKNLRKDSKQNIKYDTQGNEVIHPNKYFMKIIEMIKYYGMNFLKNFINTIKNDKNINIKDKNKILNMYAQYYKKQNNSNISQIFLSNKIMG